MLVERSACNYLYQMFRDGFGSSKNWSPVKLPKVDSVGNDDALATRCDSAILFQIAVTNAMYSLIYSPLVLSGIVIPVFNVPHSDFKFLNSDNRLLFLTETIHHLYEIYRLPILILVINDPALSPIANVSDPLWWVSLEYRDSAKALQLTPLVHTVETSDILAIPALVCRHFNLSLHDNDSRLVATLPSIPRMETHLAHLGIGTHAAIGFAKDFVRYNLGRKIPVHVWFDSVPTVQATSKDTEWTLLKRSLDDVLLYDKKLLGKPEITVLPGQHSTHPGCCRIRPATHVYVECEELVYDGVFACQRPVPVQKYQVQLKSSYRESITITPDMSIEHAHELMNQQYRRLLSVSKSL